MICRIGLAAVLAAASVCTATVASASPGDDQSFLAALDKQGIAYRSPEFAISTAKYACTLLDDGANGVAVAQELSNTNGIAIEHATFFVGASIATYCPQHADAF